MAPLTPDLRLLEDAKAGLAGDSACRYLEQHAPPLVARFEECVAQARDEEQ